MVGQSDSNAILVVGCGPVVAGCIAVVNLNWAHPDQREEQAANARLIAAAPDLLKALKDAVKMLEELHRDHFTKPNKVGTLMMEGIYSAIAKTEEKGKE